MIANYYNSTIFSILLWIQSLLFNEFGLDCYVRGYVYRVGEEVSWVREDRCDRLHVELVEDALIIYSDKYWVIVKIPDSVKGYDSFWYRWGSSNAYIHGVPVKVDWGFVMRG
ncbi:MAG: hypothetical protein QXT45_06250 [Candidatus Bilamarchaeaceae archaeon]